MPRNTDQKHVFGRPRPSQRPGGARLHISPKRDTHFRALPPPTGIEPFELDVASILPASAMDAIKRNKKLTFHLNGDMGGIKFEMDQTLVAKGMESDFKPGVDASENPAFLYLVGDCVYYNGEVKDYYAQFYQPYEYYPAPIFAVPGNHDGENLPGDNTLEGFVRNFCAPAPVKMPESQDCPRTAMTQPNVYWVLRTPLVNFLGLYSNVPAGGDIRPPQTDWIVDRLRNLPKSMPLFVTLHHPIYSADDHHSGSTYMKNMLADAVKKAGRAPEMVLAGHVHNYQRLTRNEARGTETPHLITGAGGYYNLHHIMKVNGERMIPPAVFQDEEGEEVTLETYSADHHGFMRLEVTDTAVTGRYYEVPRSQEPYSKGNQLFDYFEFDWKKRKYIPNSPSNSAVSPKRNFRQGRGTGL